MAVLRNTHRFLSHNKAFAAERKKRAPAEKQRWSAHLEGELFD